MVKYIYCSHCNAKNDSFNEFCTECGAAVDGTTAATHTVYNHDNQRTVMFGSFDAMPGAPQYGKKKLTTKDYIQYAIIIIVIIAAAITFWQIYVHFFTDTSPFP
jgi:uncharacterized membrane protein YvbJ